MKNFRFPWNRKPSEDKNSSAAVSTLRESDRRRAVRIYAPQEIKVFYRLKGQSQFTPAVLTDMSTLGIGLVMENVPSQPDIEFRFEEPPLLAGLEIKGLKRHIEKYSADDDTLQHKIGYEFVFANSTQQNQLLRWLTGYLRQEKFLDEKPATPVYKPFLNSIHPIETRVSIPHSQMEYEECLMLINSLSIHHALVQTKFFFARHEKNIIATLPLIIDTLPFGLPADADFKSALKTLRTDRHLIGEITAPTFKEDSIFLRRSMGTLQKLIVLSNLLPMVIIYAKNLGKLNYLVVQVPTNLEEFYRLWLFKDISKEGTFSGKRETPSPNGFTLMGLALEGIEQQFAEIRPELVPAIRLSNQHIDALKESYFPEADVLKKWFLQKNNLMQHLNREQQTSIHSFAPELFSNS